MVSGQHGSSFPVDRGWAWVVMAGAFGVHFFTFGYVKSFGILFIEIQEQFGATSSITSIISGVQNCCFSLTTLFVVNVLMKRFTVRSMCLAGAVLQSLGIALSSCVPNIGLVIFTLGALYGFGQALLYCPTMVILNQYFNKKRPLATAISSCGVGAGGVAYPFLSRYVVDTYGLKGGLLLLAAAALQQCVCTSLYRSPEFYKSPPHQDHISNVNDEQAQQLISEPDLNYEIIIDRHGDETENSHVKIECSNDVQVQAAILSSVDGVEDGKDRSDRQDVQEDHTESERFIECDIKYQKEEEETNVSLTKDDPLVLMNGRNENRNSGISDKQTNAIKDQNCKDVKKKSTLTCSVPALFKSLNFWVVAVFFACGGISSVLYSVFLPPLMREDMLSNDEMSVGLTVSSICEIVGRLLPGFILQCGFMRPTTIVIGPMLTCALLFHLTTLFNSFNLIICIAAAWGFLTGFFWSMMTLIVIEVFGIERLGSAFSVYILILGVFSGLSSPVAGALRDIFGTYKATYHYLGIMYWLAALSMLVVQFFIQDKKMKKTSQSSSVP